MISSKSLKVDDIIPGMPGGDGMILAPIDADVLAILIALIAICPISSCYNVC